MLKHGLQWKDAAAACGPHKTLCNSFRRWTELGVFDKIFSHLTASDGPPDTLMPDTLMIDATHFKAHRTASSLLKGGGFPATSGAQKAGRTPDSMPSAMATDDRRHVPEGWPALSDHIGAKLLYPGLCDSVKAIMIADKGYDSDDYRAALKARGITPCIPPRTGRRAPASFCNIQYKQRHKVENMFAPLKDWRRIATPYDRRADVFMAASAIAAAVLRTDQASWAGRVVVRASGS